MRRKRVTRTKMLKKAAVAFVLILCFIAGMFENLPYKQAGAESSDPRKAYEEKLKAAQDQKRELEKQKKEQEALIAEFSLEKENIETYIQELDLKLNDITLRIFELKQQITDTEEELETTKKNLEDAKKREEHQYIIMKKRIAYMYENGEATYMDLLLNSGSVADFLNQVEYTQDIARYDNNLLAAFELVDKATHFIGAAETATVKDHNRIALTVNFIVNLGVA